MNREDIILKYIGEHDGCTRTDVKNGCIKFIGEKTTDKIFKKLIDEDHKVIYDIDEVNSRIHHLHINSSYRSVFQTQKKIKNLLTSKAEEQIKNMSCTTVQLQNGGWISIPVNREFTMLAIRDLITRAAKK